MELTFTYEKSPGHWPICQAKQYLGPYYEFQGEIFMLFSYKRFYLGDFPPGLFGKGRKTLRISWTTQIGLREALFIPIAPICELQLP